MNGGARLGEVGQGGVFSIPFDDAKAAVTIFIQGGCREEPDPLADAFTSRHVQV